VVTLLRRALFLRRTALEEAKAELAAASRSLEAGAPDAEAGLRAARLRDLVEKMEIAAVALD
jgi:hypothetical protein